MNNDACELLADMIAAESCFPPIFKLDEDKTSEIYQKMFDLICAQYDGENALTIDSVRNLFREAFQSDLKSFETAMFIISMAEVQKIFNKAKKEIKNYLTNDFASKNMALLEKAEEAYKNAKCLESKALSSKLDDKNWIDDKEAPLSVLIRVTKKLLSDMRDGNDNPVLYDNKKFLSQKIADKFAEKKEVAVIYSKITKLPFVFDFHDTKMIMVGDSFPVVKSLIDNSAESDMYVGWFCDDNGVQSLLTDFGFDGVVYNADLINSTVITLDDLSYPKNKKKPTAAAAIAVMNFVQNKNTKFAAWYRIKLIEALDDENCTFFTLTESTMIDEDTEETKIIMKKRIINGTPCNVLTLYASPEDLECENPDCEEFTEVGRDDLLTDEKCDFLELNFGYFTKCIPAEGFVRSYPVKLG